MYNAAVSKTDVTVGIDPARAEVLVRELQDAERRLREVAAKVRAALADAGVASFAAAELDDVSTWCRAQAMDVRRRAAAVDVRGLNARAAESMIGLGHDLGGRRRSQLFALLGLGTEEPEVLNWLATEFPDLAARRAGAVGAVQALGHTRTAVVVDAYMGGSGDRRSGDRMSHLSRLERSHEQHARATAAEMDRFVAELDDEQVRHLAEAVLDALAKESPDKLVVMAEALAPLRARLRDQLADAARQAYIGHPDRKRVDLDALTKLYQGLGFEQRRSSNPLAEFATGLFFGDFARDDGGEASSISRTVGHLASGLLAVGDVRDTLANVSSGRWGDAALAAFGAIPIAGDLAKVGDGAAKAAAVAPKARKVWRADPARVARTMEHPRFGKFYLNKNDGLWWSVDRAQHGDSAWKVFKPTSSGLKWRADADKYGVFLQQKHKGPVGLVIPWKELSGR